MALPPIRDSVRIVQPEPHELRPRGGSHPMARTVALDDGPLGPARGGLQLDGVVSALHQHVGDDKEPADLDERRAVGREWYDSFSCPPSDSLRIEIGVGHASCGREVRPQIRGQPDVVHLFQALEDRRFRWGQSFRAVGCPTCQESLDELKGGFHALRGGRLSHTDLCAVAVAFRWDPSEAGVRPPMPAYTAFFPSSGAASWGSPPHGCATRRIRKGDGGEGGIRTRGTLASTPAWQAGLW